MNCGAFSNVSHTEASRPIQLHSQICHDAPCPLSWTAIDLDLLFSRVYSVRLAALLELDEQSRHSRSANILCLKYRFIDIYIFFNFLNLELSCNSSVYAINFNIFRLSENSADLLCEANDRCIVSLQYHCTILSNLLCDIKRGNCNTWSYLFEEFRLCGRLFT